MDPSVMLNIPGFDELSGARLLAAEIGILGATLFVFFLSLIAMALSARFASGARRARADAEARLRSAQDLVVEARQLSAQIDRAAARAEGRAHRPEARLRVAAREGADEADVDIVKSGAADAVTARNLDAARDGASVPRLMAGAKRR